MTPPAVTAPPPAAAPRAEASAPAPALRARAPFSRGRHARPPLLTARTVSISLILHLLLLIAVLFAPAPERPAVVSTGTPGTARTEVVDYLDVGEWGAMATAPAQAPAPAAAGPVAIGAGTADSVFRALPGTGAFPQRAPSGIPAAPGVPSAGGQPGAAVPGAAGGAPGAQPGAAGRGRSGPAGLGPEFGDPRLVVRPSAVPEAPLEDEERYQRHIRGRLQAINDSISGETDRQRRANDWTITDRNGRKWGINERGPVLGGRNVPVPIPLPNARRSREQEDAARREAAQRAEMDRQEESITRERHLRDRGRAIRERENQRREAEKGKQEETAP
jgi:hypothetical protein